MFTRPARHAALVLVAVLLAAAARTVGDDTSSGDRRAPKPRRRRAHPPRRCPSPGVTEDTIKVGVTYVEVEALQAVGLEFDLGDIEGGYNALVPDQINEDGGINGRQIEPVFAPVDPNSPAPAEEACVRLTEDEDVFIAMGFFLADAVICPVSTHATAVVGGDMSAERLNQAEAPWVSTTPDTDQPEAVLRALDEAGAWTAPSASSRTRWTRAWWTTRSSRRWRSWASRRPRSASPTPRPETSRPWKPTSAPSPNASSPPVSTPWSWSAAVAPTGPTPWRPTTATGPNSCSWPTTPSRLLRTVPTPPTHRCSTVRWRAAATDRPRRSSTRPGCRTASPPSRPPAVEVPAPEDVAANPDDQRFFAAFFPCPEVAVLQGWLEAAGEDLNYGALAAALDTGFEVAMPGDRHAPELRHRRPTPTATRPPTSSRWDEGAQDLVLEE